MFPVQRAGSRRRCTRIQNNTEIKVFNKITRYSSRQMMQPRRRTEKTKTNLWLDNFKLQILRDVSIFFTKAKNSRNPYIYFQNPKLSFIFNISSSLSLKEL